mgnify:CR=1 FL=1
MSGSNGWRLSLPQRRNWHRLVVNQPPPEESVPLAATPVYQELPQALRTIPLRVEPADLAEPLQQELNNLRADVEKARESIKRDLRGTF